MKKFNIFNIIDWIIIIILIIIIFGIIFISECINFTILLYSIIFLLIGGTYLLIRNTFLQLKERRYVIEANAEEIKKTFIDGVKTYEEIWKRKSNGEVVRIGSDIVSQLDQSRYSEENELINFLKNDNIQGLCDYFEKH